MQPIGPGGAHSGFTHIQIPPGPADVPPPLPRNPPRNPLRPDLLPKFPNLIFNNPLTLKAIDTSGFILHPKVLYLGIIKLKLWM